MNSDSSFPVSGIMDEIVKFCDSQVGWIRVTESNPDKDGLYEVTLLALDEDKLPTESIRGVKYFTIEKPGREISICGWEHDSVIAWKPISRPLSVY